MIALKQFLSAVQENADRIRAYELGHDGRDGKSDCIGLIIGALSLCGFSWPGVHGSNWAARNAMATFGYIEGENQCFPGMIVYKAREPCEDRYDLPGSYKNSPDQRDYYHVGVVTSTAPLVITHCTSVEGGIKQDSSLGKWRWGGKLKYVDYDTEDVPMQEYYEARVHADNGKPVNMRKSPSTQSTVMVQVPVGTVVTVAHELNDTWASINYQGKDGYMMRKFLRKSDSEPISGTAVAGENRADLETAKTALETALNIIDKLLERGRWS